MDGEGTKRFTGQRRPDVEDVATTDPNQFMDLITILDGYMEDEASKKPLLIKDGVKIIL